MSLQTGQPADEPGLLGCSALQGDRNLISLHPSAPSISTLSCAVFIKTMNSGEEPSALPAPPYPVPADWVALCSPSTALWGADLPEGPVAEGIASVLKCNLAFESWMMLPAHGFTSGQSNLTCPGSTAGQPLITGWCLGTGG